MNAKEIHLVLTILLVCWCVLFGCSTKEEYVQSTIEEARDLASRRDYERAHNTIDAALRHASDDYDLVCEKAEIYSRAREYSVAGEWYRRAGEADAKSWKAVVGAWSAHLAGAADSASAKEEIRREADSVLADAPDSLFNLTACVAGYYMMGEEESIGETRERLVDCYPESELASDIIKEEADLIGIQRDDEERLGMCDDFLARYPVTEWRAAVMRYKLYSLRRLGMLEEVVDVGKEWIRGLRDDPEVLNLVSASFLSCGVLPVDAVEAARRAVELELARGAELSDAPRRPSGAGSAPGGPTKEHEEHEEHLALYYLTLSRALLEGSDYVGAEDAVGRGMKHLHIDEDDEKTGAAFHYVLGRVHESLGRVDQAVDGYLEALVVGGRKNHWAAKADTAMASLFEREFAAGREGARGALRGSREADQGGGTQGGQARKRAELLDFLRDRAGYDGPVFTDVASEVGLGNRRETRVAWGDYDGDDYDDLLLNGSVLFRNCGDGTFEDVTDEAGIGYTGTSGGVWADIDNDGDLDFYAISSGTGSRADRLWINLGDGTFADATRAVGGMADEYTTEGAAWGDYDCDGLVDLYVANYEKPHRGDYGNLGRGNPDILYHNEGGVFRDVTEEAGMVPPFGEHLCGRGVNWGDFDNDGDLDIYVSNYRLQENLLWRNEGDGTFTNVAPRLGVSGTEQDGWWGHTIGSEWGDYDNDGDLDLVTGNLAHPRYIEISDMTMLYENSGGGRAPFRERRKDAGIKYAETHSDVAWGDVDGDGDLDLYITSVYPDCASFLYSNDGRGNFRDITYLAGVRAFNTWGCAMSDYDLDGDLDIAVGGGGGLCLFRNDGPRAGSRGPGNHWLGVKVVGTCSNSAGIGARIKVTSGWRTRIREVQGGKGTTSQHSLTAHFGLGRRGRSVDVEVAFLGGKTVVLEDVEVDQMIVVMEPD